MGVNSHPAFDEKPGIKFAWPNYKTETRLEHEETQVDTSGRGGH